jgi:pyrroline-5-carboxylate reductase
VEKFRNIGFIGGGRIVRILVAALEREGYDLSAIAFSESSDEAAAKTRGEFPGLRRLGQAEVAAASELLFIALPPPAIAPAIGEGKLRPRDGAIVVTLSPKGGIAAISALLGGFARVARMIPNAPSLIGQGYNPVSYSDALGDSDRAALGAVFSAFGEHPEVEDGQIEAYAVLTAMGPTYFFYQFYELMRQAEGFGLGEAAVRKAAKAMLSGALATVFDSGLPPERVLDLIPGKPMAPHEAAIAAMYGEALPAAYAKLKS